MNDELTNIDISEQLENDNDEFSVVVKNRKDILNDIGFDNIEDKVLCNDIIKSLENFAADNIRNMKVVNIPMIGCVRINPIRRALRDKKLHLSLIRSNLTKEEYKNYVRDTIVELETKQKAIDKYKARFNRIKSVYKKKYTLMYNTIGKAYAELYITALTLFNEVPYDEEWEETYQKLNGGHQEDVGDVVLKDRELLSNNGLVVISSTLSKKDKSMIIDPEIITRGFIYSKENNEIINEIKRISTEIIRNNTFSNKYADYVKIRNDIREQVGQYLYKETQCKPVILTVIQEI